MANDITLSLRNNTASDIYLNKDGLSFILSASATLDVSNFIESETINASSQLFTYLTTPIGSPSITLFVDGAQIGVNDLVNVLVNRANFKNTAGSSTAEPNGFEKNIQTTTNISFNNGTRQFTIAPTGSSFVVWIGNNRFTKTTETVTITNTEGIWYIYYNNSGNLIASQTVWDLSLHAPVTLIYWNATNSQAIVFNDERHTCIMDWTTHQYLHNVKGTVYTSGLVLTPTNLDGPETSNSSSRITLADGVIRDEDIVANITHSTSPTSIFQQQLRMVDAVNGNYAAIPIYYQFGTTPVWRKLAANQYPVHLPSGGSYAAWNENQGGGTGWVISQADIINDNVVYWIFGTTNISEPIIAIMGRGKFPTTYDASANAFINDVLASVFPFAETKLLYRLIFYTDAAMTNATKTVLKVVTSYKEIPDKMLIGEILPPRFLDFGTYYQSFSSLTVSTTTSGTFQNKITVTTQELPAGTYRIGVQYTWYHTSTSDDFEARILIDGSTGVGTYSTDGYYFNKAEPEDAGTDQRYSSAGFIYITWADSNTRTLNLQYRNAGAGGVTSGISNAIIEIWRVS